MNTERMLINHVDYFVDYLRTRRSDSSCEEFFKKILLLRISSIELQWSFQA